MIIILKKNKNWW